MGKNIVVWSQQTQNRCEMQTKLYKYSRKKSCFEKSFNEVSLIVGSDLDIIGFDYCFFCFELLLKFDVVYWYWSKLIG